MRTLGKIAYWLVAVTLVSVILISLDFTFVKAVLFALIFCPCALALEYFMPKARKPIEKVYLSMAVLVAVILLILVLHHQVWALLSPDIYKFDRKEVPLMLINPVFLGLILTALSLGDYFWGKWLIRHFKAETRTVTFFSDRRSVTLYHNDIAYIESNDTDVRVVTRSGEVYRNKTGISQWENLLGDGFLRIHRSYLVNIEMAVLVSPDTVAVGASHLPVSRKYKEFVNGVLPTAPSHAPGRGPSGSTPKDNQFRPNHYESAEKSAGMEAADY